jgi:hypothetical protein
MIKKNLKTGEITHDYTPEQKDTLWENIIHFAAKQPPEEEEEK